MNETKEEDSLVTSLSEGSAVSNFWRAYTDREWSIKQDGFAVDERTEDDVSGVALKGEMHFVQSGPKRLKSEVADTDFHDEFKTDDLDGMVAFFQAKTNCSIVVALSPEPTKKENAFADSPVGTTSYEIVFGAERNVFTKITRSTYIHNRKGAPDGTKEDETIKIPSRVCRGYDSTQDSDEPKDDSWVSYWICLSHTKLYIGIGKIPGRQCYAVMEPPSKASESFGIQSSTESKEKSMDSTTELQSAPLPIRYFGIGIAHSGSRPPVVRKLDVRNLVVTNVPPCLGELLKSIPVQEFLPVICLSPLLPSSSGMEVEDNETNELKTFMEKYKAECITRRRRAEKYGTDYQEQNFMDFLPWTYRKRLAWKAPKVSTSAKDSTGGLIAGGIDFSDPNEISKRQSRLSRFAAEPAKEIQDTAETRPIRTTWKGLPVEQAWDKESMLRPVRRDPPPYLWKECPSNAETIETYKNAPDPFAMYDETTKATTWVEDKVHISAIDWAAFRQIGNDDLMKHFESYGPVKYIEWLGDVNCNICFESKSSAARALVCMSNELPSPPPTTLTSPAKPIDLGCMTWRLGKRSIRKMNNDWRGKRGTTARYLMRMAMTEDMLTERPKSAPEPPGGFSTTEVLGPDSDYNSNRSKATAGGNKRRHQKRNTPPEKNSSGKRQRNETTKAFGNRSNRSAARLDRRKSRTNNTSNNASGESLLNRGLSSSRAGFSVEEMEQERRAKKRQKTS